MYKPVRLDGRDRAVRLGVQGKAEQWLRGAEAWWVRVEAWQSGRGSRALWSGRAFGCARQSGAAAWRSGVAWRGGAEAWRSGGGGRALWSGGAFGCSPYMILLLVLANKENMQASTRSLVTKLVNALTAKLEIGSPFACLYLLGNPDHYTSHTFINFYWKSFVCEAQSVFLTSPEEADELPEKVMLNKSEGNFVAISKVYDYIYRPSVFGTMNLYDWIRCANKRKRSSKHHKKDLMEDDIIEEELDDTDSEDELDMLRNPFVGGGPKSESDWVESNDSYNEDDELNIDDNVQITKDETQFYSFLPDHPQHHTHEVQRTCLSDLVVPNFIGGTLPQCDQGDCEYYCSTLLALFKPWRTGNDLKSANETWEKAFDEYNFSPEQMNLMSRFNLRYECLDARDDYFAMLFER